MNRLCNKLNDVPNRELLYELYPYIWDMRGVTSLMNSYVTWLGKLDEYLAASNYSSDFSSELELSFKNDSTPILHFVCPFTRIDCLSSPARKVMIEIVG